MICLSNAQCRHWYLSQGRHKRAMMMCLLCGLSSLRALVKSSQTRTTSAQRVNFLAQTTMPELTPRKAAVSANVPGDNNVASCKQWSASLESHAQRKLWGSSGKTLEEGQSQLWLFTTHKSLKKPKNMYSLKSPEQIWTVTYSKSTKNSDRYSILLYIFPRIWL